MLSSDKIKLILAAVGAVCVALAAYFPPPNQIGVVALGLTGLLGSLGLISGGITSSQPKPPLPPPTP